MIEKRIYARRATDVIVVGPITEKNLGEISVWCDGRDTTGLGPEMPSFIAFTFGGPYSNGHHQIADIGDYIACIGPGKYVPLKPDELENGYDLVGVKETR